MENEIKKTPELGPTFLSLYAMKIAYMLGCGEDLATALARSGAARVSVKVLAGFKRLQNKKTSMESR